ncbi:MAG: uroporphyrinogen-III C-methyltransferase, partial [Dehalococcoidia bacterium]|nr:uroporphyrinogen-III C-methyltransferase [Dehalococcoidia bacterium]
MKPGKVYLIGAGPGDPGLITAKGLRCLETADVVVYDHLVDESLLEPARKDARLISAGKQQSHHTLSQEEINSLLISLGREGHVVARLKGGDPFVLGRGGEEAEALAAAGIPFEVVPGVTAAVAVPAYAGIPLTHRRLASSFAVVTGHETPDKGQSTIDWTRLAGGADTLVFLMGVTNLAPICRALVEHGRSPVTPAAVIRWGTYPRQETVTGTLVDIAQRATEAGMAPPAVLVVGEVVGLRDALRWFDNRPLFGKRILVTRSRHQASRLSKLLEQEGAEPVELPTIEIQQAPSPSLDSALYRMGDFSWVVLTSANGVEALFSRLIELGRDARALGGVKICAIGDATAEALRGWGLRADLVPSKFSAGGILQAFEGQDITGVRFLLPRVEAVPPELADGLRQRGAEVEELALYRTQPADPSDQARELVESADIITFTSSSTVKGLARLVGGDVGFINRATVACIGPVTAATAAGMGIRTDVVASTHTIPGLVSA